MSDQKTQAGTPPSDEEIHQRFIEAIIDQRLLPGTKLVEDKLGQAFGVSRTRVRQVLIRLAQEQVVTLEPNKGASVAQPSIEDAREVFEARALVEAVLVGRFIERATPADLQALEECIEAEEEARREGDHATALRLSGRFHLMIAEVSGHQTFARMLAMLISRTSLILMSYAPLARSERQALAAVPARWVDACRCNAHRGVLTALREARRPRAGMADVATWLTEAQQRMREHLGDMEAGLCFNLPDAPQADVVDLFSQAPASGRRPRRTVPAPNKG